MGNKELRGRKPTNTQGNNFQMTVYKFLARTMKKEDDQLIDDTRNREKPEEEHQSGESNDNP